MTDPGPIRVVGVGSPHGDDAVAWEALRQLRTEGLERPGVTLHLVEGGQCLLDLLDGQGTLVLLDAVSADGGPGTIHCFEWPDERLADFHSGSTHMMRPAEALRLASLLGLAPPRVVVLGVEARSFEPGTPLTPAVAAALPELLRRVREIVTITAETEGVYRA